MVGWIGVLFGIVTFLFAVFLNHSLGIYWDGIITAVIYATLIIVYHINDSRYYLIFIVINGLFILAKIFYLLFATIMLVTMPVSWRRSVHSGLSGVYYNREPAIPGTGFYEPDNGASLLETIRGVLGTVKLGGRSQVIYHGEDNMEESQTSTAIMLGILTLSIVLNGLFEYIVFRAYIYLKQNTQQPYTQSIAPSVIKPVYVATTSEKMPIPSMDHEPYNHSVISRQPTPGAYSTSTVV
ncbi:hypothetical protein AAVH_13020 [Aphelenchoides avenae]|nr:hypothetical protein AAVH_13020 [Aphelenchus avenae]